MTTPFDTPPDWAAIDRYLAGTCSPEELRTIETRLATDPQLAAAIEVLRTADRRPDMPPPRFDSTTAWRQVEAKLGTSEFHRAAKRRSTLYLSRAPDTTLGAQPHTLTRGLIHGWGRLVSSLAVVAIGFTGAGVWMHHALTHSATDARQTSTTGRDYTTARGQRATVQLSDGSSAVLAPDTRLHVEMTATHRTVTVTGHAFFTVTRDDRRAFTVRAQRATVRVLGTAFGVRAYPSDQTTQIIVREGRVAVRMKSEATDETTTPLGTPLVLVARDAATVSETGISSLTHDADLAELTGWTSGRLAFHDVPVSTVLRELSRWFDLDFRAATPQLAARHMTAVFRDDALDHVLDLLSTSLGADLTRSGRTVTLASRASRTHVSP